MPRQSSKRVTVNNEFDAAYLAAALQMKKEYDDSVMEGLTEKDAQMRRTQYLRYMRRTQIILTEWAKEKIDKYTESLNK